MITKQQWRIIHEIDKNKDVFLSMITDGAQKRELENLYGLFKKALNEYALKLSDEAIARAGYQGALKTHKLDASIAGGIANGAAGIGAGIHTANTIDQNNQNIDKVRGDYRAKVFDASQATTKRELAFLSITMRIDEKLDSISDIRKKREKDLEEQYNLAKTCIDKNDNKRAIEILEGMVDYKDAKQLIKDCKNKKQGKLFGGIAIFALIMSAITALIAKVWFLFPMYFVAWFIMGLIVAIKNKL